MTLSQIPDLPEAELSAAVAELMEFAAQESSSGANALVTLATDPQGRTRINSFCQEAMRAFGACAHGLAVDIPERARVLNEVVDRHPGLVWALEGYRQNIALSELNSLLIENTDLAAYAQSRLDQWLQPTLE